MPASEKERRDRREQLVQATIAIVLEVGLRAAKTRAVTERADVGTGLLNHYFRWPELRALAWVRIFEAVTLDQFPKSDDPRADVEWYFTTAFTEEARRLWHLWIEAAELAASDAAMKAALAKVSAQSHDRLRELLRAGCKKNLWQLPDPEGTSVRLSAMYDGLAGMLLSPTGKMEPAQAEAHLRKAFAQECQSP